MKQGLRIAVADDEETMRMYLEDTLPDFGHEVVATAKDGRELIERVRATRPDLIVTDIKMLPLDGVGAIREIYRDMTVPIVFLTGYAEEHFPIRGNLIHVFLTKPVDRQRLQEGIERALRLFREAYGIAPLPEERPASPEA